MSNSNLEKAASVIGCDATAGSIQAALKLQCPGIDGVAIHKNSADLIQEILLGECRLERLIVNDESFLIRVVQVVSVRIRNPFDSSQELFELRQEYANGRIVERGFSGVSEKIQGAENPHNAAVRAVKEELGISAIEIDLLTECDRAFNAKSAYQGIDSYTDLWEFEATISEQDFREEYLEVQASKTTVFGWR